MTTLWTMLIIVSNLSGGLALLPSYSFETREDCEKARFDPIMDLSRVNVYSVCVPYDEFSGFGE